MKRILITGENSYIGNSFAKFLDENYQDDYFVTKISLKNDKWISLDFSKYDIILHVAGIVHNSSFSNKKSVFDTVNRDLTINLAKKAKAENIGQFVFMSSIMVFGNPQDGKITKELTPAPANHYGRSKFEAEKALLELEDNQFKVSIIRAPLIYGPNSKGNYQKLSKFALITPIFPDYRNKRSMLYIENLCFSLTEIMERQLNGIFHLQNVEYIETSKLVKEIADNHKRRIKFIKFINPLIKISLKVNYINKIFGNLYYDFGTLDKKYIRFEESIRRTEN